MCGIGGEVIWSGAAPVAFAAVAEQIARLAHRGPDGWGVYRSADERALLLHTRLAIVDLNGGQQPLRNETGDIWAIVNGEFYDFERLRRDLIAAGHVFATRSDSELVVHLYEEYGEDFPRHLRGEFAIALYDERRRSLLLVRDRFGIKPLYYAELTEPDARRVLFSSEQKAILAHPGWRTRLNRRSILSILSMLYPPSETLFEGVRQLPPATVLRASPEGVALRRYWRLPPPPEDPVTAATGGVRAARAASSAGELHPAPRAAASVMAARQTAMTPTAAPHTPADAALLDEFRARFDEAVRLRLHGDVEVGAYLSGGIDSAAAACTAASILRSGSGARLKTFTIGFANQAYDEAAHATTIAAHAGAEHHVRAIGPGELSAHLAESLWHSELPAMNGHGAAKYLLSDLAHRSVRVVVSGEGADEVLFGYPQFRHQQLLDAVQADPQDRTARNALRRFNNEERGSFGIWAMPRYPRYDEIMRLFGGYPYGVVRSMGVRTAQTIALSRPLRELRRAWDPLTAVAGEVRDQTEGLTSILATQGLMVATDLPVYILNMLGDRMEMAHSIEARLPFLDHPLVEFVAGLPLALRTRHGCVKHVLRAALRDVVPAELQQRRKKLFLAPSLEVLGLLQHSDLADEYLSSRRTREVGVIRPVVLQWVRRLVHILPRQSRIYGMCEGILVSMLSLNLLEEMYCRAPQAWSERFRKALPPPLPPPPVGERYLAFGEHVGLRTAQRPPVRS